jgi:hypothetical protein
VEVLLGRPTLEGIIHLGLIPSTTTLRTPTAPHLIDGESMVGAVAEDIVCNAKTES